MLTKKDVLVINKDLIPPGKIVGTYTFLRDMGKTLEKGKALQLTAEDAAEAKKVQNRWRAYFKGKAHTRHEVQPDKKVRLFLWLED